MLAFTSAASAQIRIMIVPFEFIDTSNEVNAQADQHMRRRALFSATLLEEFAKQGVSAAQASNCSDGECSVKRHGVAALSQQAVATGTDILMIGEIKKMSTLIGQVKFALIDLKTNKAICDRYLSYRGDSDEAWTRAAKFAVKDVMRHCIP